MSVVVKGLDIPTSCSECPLNYDQMGCTITGTRWWSDTTVLLNFDYDKERLYDCPLVEINNIEDLRKDVSAMLKDEPNAVCQSSINNIIKCIHDLSDEDVNKLIHILWYEYIQNTDRLKSYITDCDQAQVYDIRHKLVEILLELNCVKFNDNKIYLSWNDVDQFIKAIARDYNHMQLPGVYGIPRGGLILAVMISHKLNIPLLTAPTPNCMIVDDIWDSGESLQHYYKNSSCLSSKPDYHIVTMVYNIYSPAEGAPEYYHTTKQDQWIVFPWEAD